jgi:hypothetical protein
MSQFTSDNCGLENAQVMDDTQALWSDVIEAVRRRAAPEAWENLDGRTTALRERLDCFRIRRHHEE